MFIHNKMKKYLSDDLFMKYPIKTLCDDDFVATNICKLLEKTNCIASNYCNIELIEMIK